MPLASTGRRPAGCRHIAAASCEILESRRLLASVTVDLGQPIRPATEAMLGTNLAWWQWELDTPRMEQMIRDAGLKLLRMPGGSSSNDNRHFNNPAPYDGYKTPPVMANVVEHVGADGMITINYGTGSPQEGAAFLAYYNAQVGDTTVIGSGQQWDDANKVWVQKDWRTAGYWASLRAASPLAVDDGLNFLRVNHPAPWGFTYWEVGNENYATWENDRHGQGGDTGAPQDPATYIAFAKTFSDLAHQIDSDVQVGLDVTLPMQWNLTDQQWTAHILQQAATRGLVPGFLSDHIYLGGRTDQDLLLHTVNDPTSTDGWAPQNWAGRATAYRNLLTANLGNPGNGVEIMVTEFNCDLGSMQSTSLVSGLFMADAIGGVLQTEYAAALQWDLTNGYSTGVDTAGHYGWRLGADNGMISTGGGPAPASGPYIPYPAYFAEQLASKVIHTGDTVVKATSSDPYLSTYAIQQANGHLGLLVINKSATDSLSGTFSLAGFRPAGEAQFWQYGKAEDTAQSLTTDGHASLTNWASTIDLVGSSFTYTFPSYSMTVIDLDKAAPSVQAFQVNGGAVQRSMVTTLLLTFSERVTVGSSLLLQIHGGGGVSGVLMSVSNPSGDGIHYTMTFSGSAVVGGSLPDGIYDFIINGAGVTDSTGHVVAGTPTWTFHRLFGDEDGNKVVNASDYTALRNCFDTHSTDPRFDAAFDYDNNSVINASDLTQFRKRFSVRYVY